MEIRWATLELGTAQLSVLGLESGEPIPWWLRVGGIAAFGLIVAAFMVLIQTSHTGGQKMAWAAVVLFLPIIGPLIYLISETIRHRRNNPRPTKGRAEIMPPEDLE